jgi:hypothetical protein
VILLSHLMTFLLAFASVHPTAPRVVQVLKEFDRISSGSLWPGSFLGASGWRVVVETEDPVFPQGFDPWNVERLSAADVLHTRWIKLGNASGSLEVLDRHCLTEGAGKHPLFEGVARATITGLPSEPRIEETDGAVEISEKGLTLTLRGARVTRDGQTVTITLGPRPPSHGATRADPSLPPSLKLRRTGRSG